MNSTIYGRIGQDATLDRTGGGTSVANFSVALNVYKKGDKETTWVRAKLFGTQAEKLTPFLTKGTSVALAGDLVLHEYESRDGGNKTQLEINAQSVALLGGGENRTKAKAATADDDIPF